MQTIGSDPGVAPPWAPFLPTSRQEMARLGWAQADVILFTGDAYVDHPSFGVALIGRALERAGHRVAVVPQPNWRDDLRDFTKLGPPRLFFGVTSGSMDSMVNHYTASKRLRSDDAYTPEGRAGHRPDRAVAIYSQIIRRLYPDVPLVLGGIEASLRRLAHYDYWDNALRPSLLLDTLAHLLVYGMGERPILAIADRLRQGHPIGQLTDIPQTAFITQDKSYLLDDKNVVLYSYDQCLKDARRFGENFRRMEEESNRWEAARLVEPHGAQLVVVNPPFPPPAEGEMDRWWDLPFARAPHPRYRGKRIPAWEMIKFSVTIHRGCFGGCSFCTISAHQGKFVSSRSEASIVREVERIQRMPDFQGYLSDLGGPSANMYRMGGVNLGRCRACSRASCIHPNICRNLGTSHEPLIALYRRVRSMPGVKKVFVGSGVRHDLFAHGRGADAQEYFEELVAHHVSGRLKVAPEHTEPEVLGLMRKPSFELFRELKARFEAINRKHSLNQQLIPYFISGHPGCTGAHMERLARQLRGLNLQPEQVQDFTPTPMTLASTIFYTGEDPYTGRRVPVVRDMDGKRRQKERFFWRKQPWGGGGRRAIGG